MTKKILSVILISMSMNVFAQRIFNMEDVFTSREMYPQSLRQLQFYAKTNAYVYVQGDLLQATAPYTETSVLVALTDLQIALAACGETVSSFPSIVYWLNEQEFYCYFRNKLFAYNIQEKKAELLFQMDKKANNIVWDYAHQRVSYTVGSDLMAGIFGQEAVRVNANQEKEVKYGHVVHRNEFGINKGSFWSPKGNCLAFYRMDESMVTDYPIVNTTTRIATLQQEKYPMAGQTSHQVTLGVYNVNSGKTIYMKTGEPLDQFLCSVTWSPDEQYIYIAVLNREQNHLKLNKYNVQTGDFVQTLFEETNARYVEPSDPLYFLPNNASQFIWVSQKSGYKHLHLYDVSGKEIKQLTKGNWVVMSFEGFSSKGDKVYFTSNKDEIVGQRFFVLDMKTSNIQPICNQEGTHTVLPSSDGKYFIDKYSSLHLPAKITIQNAKGKTLATILEDTIALKGFALPEVSIGMLKNNNGDSLYYRLIKPINFDPNKKYPVFFYVYGGPHSQLVTNNWMSGGHFLHYMAQKGYVVFTLDNRGTANRGFEFESTIHRRLGTVEVEDQMVGVKYLQSLPFVDTDRFSIDGWSYGGFMTLTLKLQHPEVFKVATAGGPVIDWKYYEVMYGERYMDTPQENPEGYKNNSLLNQVEKIDGHILIIHGAVDPTVVWQNSLQFLTEAIKHRKQVDYFVYPTHQHNVIGIDRVHLWNKIEQYHALHNRD